MNVRTEVVRVDPDAPDAAAIAGAAARLRQGGLVAFPTETVYGLGANALDPAAVARVFAAKDRPATDPLIVHIAHIGQLRQVAADVPPGARALALAFWAGPLTLVLPKRPEVPDIVTAGLATVAVRVPAHRVARALIEVAGVPVAAPSANRFSRPSPTTAAHVLADLDGRIDLVLDGGPAPIGVESTIVDFTVAPPVVRRPGGVTIEQVRAVLPEVIVVERFETGEAPAAAPGQLLRHYAPRAPLTLYEGAPEAVVARLAAEIRLAAESGETIGVLAPEEDLEALAPATAGLVASGRLVVAACGSRREPERAARDLFGALRDLDRRGVTAIVASVVEPTGVGAAVRDRLVRAAEGRVRRV